MSYVNYYLCFEFFILVSMIKYKFSLMTQWQQFIVFKTGQTMSRTSANHGGSQKSLGSQDHPGDLFEDPAVNHNAHFDIVIETSWRRRYRMRTLNDRVLDWLHNPQLPIDNSWDDWFSLPEVGSPQSACILLEEAVEEDTGANNIQNGDDNQDDDINQDDVNNQDDASENEPEVGHFDEPSGLFGVNQWEDHMEGDVEPVQDNPDQEMDEGEWAEFLDEILYPAGDNLVQEMDEDECEAIMNEIINPEDGNFIHDDEEIPDDDRDLEQDTPVQDMDVSEQEGQMDDVPVQENAEVSNDEISDTELSDLEISDSEISDSDRDSEQDANDIDMEISSDED